VDQSFPLNAQAISDMTIFREVLILRKIESQSVVKIDGVVLEKGALYFSYSPFVSMDLEYAARTMKLNPAQIKCIIYQLLVTVNYLHRQELVHRNIKPTTILMSDDCNIKLCGFSRARSTLDEKQLDLYSPKQPYNYTAPEIIISEMDLEPLEAINWKAADIWSVGCIFVELLVGEPPFKGNDWSTYLKNVYHVLDCHPPNLSDNKPLRGGLYPPQENNTLPTLLNKSPYASHPSFRNATEVIQGMLNFEATSRFEASYALKHKYFAEVLGVLDLSRGRDISRELTDNCLPQFVNEYCAGIV